MSDDEHQEQGKGGAKGAKRKAPMTWEEGVQKVRRTIGWYNKNGGLNAEIHYKTVSPYLEAMNPRDALKLLKELEEKGPSLRNPTAWIKRAAENQGPDLDKKVKSTISWWNKNGKLKEQIKYDDARQALAHLPAGTALKLLKGMEGKEEQITNPTGWICKAAWKAVEREGAAAAEAWEPPAAPRVVKGAGAGWKASGKGGPAIGSSGKSAAGKGKAAAGKGKGASRAGGAAIGSKGQDDSGVDMKVKKTIGWYNKLGGLQAEIRYVEVAHELAQVGTQEALKILSGLDPEKNDNSKIKNPTAWIKKAAQRLLG